MQTNKSKQMLFNQNLGANRAANDFYATPEEVTELFLLNFRNLPELKKVWEPACGQGHLSKVLKSYIPNVKSTDLIDRGYGKVLDFLTYKKPFKGSIITNPPFSHILEFTEHALNIVEDNNYVIFLCRFQFLESNKRRHLFDKNIHSIYIHSTRVGCAKNGDFSNIPKGMTYCWVVFKKGYTKTPNFYWL